MQDLSAVGPFVVKNLEILFPDHFDLFKLD